MQVRLVVTLKAAFLRVLAAVQSCAAERRRTTKSTHIEHDCSGFYTQLRLRMLVHSTHVLCGYDILTHQIILTQAKSPDWQYFLLYMCKGGWYQWSMRGGFEIS
jgi:hypothetical protein